MGYEPLTKYVSLSVTLLQIGLAVYLSKHTSLHPLSWQFCLPHTPLVERRIRTHSWRFTRSPTTWPSRATCQQALGNPRQRSHRCTLCHGVQTIPSRTSQIPRRRRNRYRPPYQFESIVLKNVLGKTFFATFQIFFYALRPGFVRAQRPTIWHALNLAFILTFNTLLVKYAGWTALLYLLFPPFLQGAYIRVQPTLSPNTTCLPGFNRKRGPTTARLTC